MCGRYNVIDDPFLRELMRDLGIDALLSSRTNIAPTEHIPVVLEGEGGRELRSMRWWLTPSWSDGPSTRYSMFNAKGETIATSRAFRGPFRRQRAIVPASSFIEWQASPAGKQPWLIKPESGAFAFAAVWDHWERGEEVVESCAIITTAAVPAFAHIHKRQPVMLTLNDFSSWLDPARQIDNPEHYFKPRLPGPLRVAPVSKAINNARNKDERAMVAEAEGEVIRG